MKFSDRVEIVNYILFKLLDTLFNRIFFIIGSHNKIYFI